MNNSYFNPNMVSSRIPNNVTGEYNTSNLVPDMPDAELPMEQSYVENILRRNKGKVASFYMTFPDSNEWRDKVFEGIIEEAGKDHLVMSDPKTGKWSLILLIYLNFVEFDEKINYSHAYSEITF